MASTYLKPGSPWIWLRYKSTEGKWKARPTEYRPGNMGDRRQAELLARKITEEEQIARSTGGNNGRRFSEWVVPWIESTYGSSLNSTPAVYKRWWRSMERFLATQNPPVDMATQVTRELIGKYVLWREAHGGCRNSAIMEIKFLGTVIREAVNRGHRKDNPIAKPGLRKAPTPTKLIWSNEQISTAVAFLEREKSLWMRCAFYFGLYQACRLRQCAVPLSAIRFDLNKIIYPVELVKGHEGFSQPIDPRFLPILKGLVAEARSKKQTHLCTIPWDCSLRFRRTFDRAGLHGLVHHGLRHTWITRAANAGVPESQAMTFCHHQSTEVHRVYKHLNVVGIEHVPSLLDLPAFASPAPQPSAQQSPAARTKNASPKSGAQTRKRNPR